MSIFELQAEGCSLQLWNTHKASLKMNFKGLLQEVKAQNRMGAAKPKSVHQYEAPVTGDSVDSVCGSNGSVHEEEREGTSSKPRTPVTNPNARQPVLKPMATIVGMIRSDLGMPWDMSIPGTISKSMSTLGMEDDGTSTLKDKAVRVATTLNINVTEEHRNESAPGLQSLKFVRILSW